MSFFDIFKPATPAAPESNQQQQQPADETNNQQQNNQQQTNNNQQQQGAQPNPSEAPLDSFKDLWETPENSGNENNQTLFGEVDPKKIFEAAKTANFSSLISQDNLQAIEQGGEAARKAFQESLNSVAQAVFAQSTLATTKIVEQAVAKATAKYEAGLPEAVKRHMASDSLLTENPALSNPAAAPIIAALQSQLAVKFPKATASELKEMAKNFLGNFANAVTPGTKENNASNGQQSKTAGDDIDWMAYVSNDLNQR